MPYKDKQKHRDHAKEYMKTYRIKFEEKFKLIRRRVNLRREYGLTIEEYEAIKLKYNSTCQCCERTENLCLDHDHKTKRIRGFLCGPCNSALGLVRENPQTLSNMINYLALNKTVGEDYVKS